MDFNLPYTRGIMSGKFKRTVRKAAMSNAFTRAIYKKLETIKHNALIKKYSARPVDPDLIFFEAYKGRTFACSPKAIYLAMLKDEAYAGKRFVWMFNNPAGHEDLARNPRTTVTHRLSPEHIEAALTAGLIVTNSRIEHVLLPREGQFVLQTWHGTPLKRLGCDIEVDGSSAEELDKIHEGYRFDGRLLSALISPSPYATKHLSSAFGLTGSPEKVWETGYPRNDYLYNYTADDAAAIRKRLGIGPDKRVILYAPTFRDVNYVSGVGFINKLYVDLEALKARFGDECVLILRMHYFAAADGNYAIPGDFVIDGNSVDDINELYVISDVLITDYSSVMYDYAALKRPMIFFMPDIEEYRSSIRDFYMDPAKLPGRITTTQEELEDELGHVVEEYRTQGQCTCGYSDFLAEFQPYEDGKRAEEVLRRLKNSGH